MMDIDVRQTQLFLDNEIIAHQTLLERVIHQPVRSWRNPILTPEKPWEDGGITMVAGIYRDQAAGMFRGWYTTATDGYGDYVSMLCTVTSDDGIHWTRPELDICREVIGNPSNVVHASKLHWDGPTVLHDPSDADRPWKLVLYQDNRRPPGGVFIGASPDGLHWTIPDDPDDAILTRFGDRTTALLDPEADEPIVILTRDWDDMMGRQHVRCIYRAGSRNGRALSSPPELVLRPDLEDGPYVDFYQMSAFRYESVYIGLIERYHSCEPPYSDVELAVSRDARSWQRVRPRAAFFAPPPHGREQGAFDYAAATPANSPPILHNGAIWLYYYGDSRFHGDRFLNKSRCIGLARLRPDGFVSLRADKREGCLVTKPFTWPGGRLQYNCRRQGGNLWQYGPDDRGDGGIRTEILDEDGNTIPGYSRDDSDMLRRDGTAAEPTWSDQPQNLAALVGRKIALQLILRSAEIFAFRSSEP